MASSEASKAFRETRTIFPGRATGVFRLGPFGDRCHEHFPQHFWGHLYAEFVENCRMA